MIKNTLFRRILANNTASKIIDTLSPFIGEPRQTRIRQILDHRLSSLQLAIESPTDVNNALAAFRTAEAFGIGHVHIIKPDNPAASLRRITAGAFYWINIHFHDSLNDFLTYRDQQSLKLAGGIINAPTGTEGIPIDGPLCIMVGNEHRGLSQACIEALDHTYTIAMCGMTESLNLSVSAAISLFEISQRKRTTLSSTGDLSPAEYQQEQARYYMNSVSQRLLDGLVRTDVLE